MVHRVCAAPRCPMWRGAVPVPLCAAVCQHMHITYIIMLYHSISYDIIVCVYVYVYIYIYIYIHSTHRERERDTSRLATRRTTPACGGFESTRSERRGSRTELGTSDVIIINYNIYIYIYIYNLTQYIIITDSSRAKREPDGTRNFPT